MSMEIANGPGAIRKALERAGMKFNVQNDARESVDRLRAFCLNPQKAFEDWQRSQTVAKEGGAVGDGGKND